MHQATLHGFTLELGQRLARFQVLTTLCALDLLFHAPLTYYSIRPYTASVSGLELLVYAALSY